MSTIVILGLLAVIAISVVSFAQVLKLLIENREPAAPRPKLFKRPAASNSTPALVGTPVEKSSVDDVPAGGPDGVTRIDMTGGDEYKELHELPKSVLTSAVDAYLHGDGSAEGAIVSVIEGEE